MTKQWSPPAPWTKTAVTSGLLDHALSAHAMGLCVLPPSQDGLKRPGVGDWNRFQNQRPTEKVIRRWYSNPACTGIGLVCGEVSGGLELFELEDAETFEAFARLIADHDSGDNGLSRLWHRLIDGYLEKTPGGGFHVLWRTPLPEGHHVREGNQKLACRPRADGGVQVLIETRGEGGYTVVAPSSGSVHPSGGAYRLLRGGFESIQTVAEDERDTLFSLARMLDEMPRTAHGSPGASSTKGDRPGDRFNAETSWEELLPRYGITFVRRDGEMSYWRRPGKGQGVSATTNYKGSGVFKPFSTSMPFDTTKTYSPFAVYTVMEHAGDFKAAARTLGEHYRKMDRHSSAAALAPFSQRAAVELPSAPDFPLDVLPPAVLAYCEAAADSLSTPVEMVAVPLLGLSGALIGNRLSLVMKSGYVEYPVLFLAIVAPPGSAKTPALKLARWPLHALQKDAELVFRDQWTIYEAATEARSRLTPKERGLKPVEPQLRHYFSTNLTIEALITMLEHAPGVAVIRDEILSWISSMDQYRAAKGSDRQEYLSLWSSGTIKVDRRGAKSTYCDAPVVCVVGGIQPDMAGDLHDAARGRDGFVERILPIVPDVEPMPWTDNEIAPERFADVLGVFRALDALPPADHTRSADGQLSAGIGVKLSTTARRTFVGWYNENQALISASQGVESGFYSKLPAHVARLALILHTLWNPSDPRVMVSGERMDDAIALGEFFRAHTARFLALIQNQPPRVASAGVAPRITRVLRGPDSWADDGWVSRSILMDSLRTISAETLTTELEVLENAGEIERRMKAGKGRPAEQWRLVAEERGHSDIRSFGRSQSEVSATCSERDLTRSGMNFLRITEYPNPVVVENAN